MTDAIAGPRVPGPFGTLLRGWRRIRGLSQLALANGLRMSPRHLSFLETGRAQPSRTMVLHLAVGLGVPLRERNSLLLAAGFAPLYRETNLDAPELAPVHRALTAILEGHEPCPAVILDRRWNLLRANQGATRLFNFLMRDRRPPTEPNMLRAIFDPASIRPFVVDWEPLVDALMQRVHREAVGGVPDPGLLRDLLAYPGVPASLGVPRPEAALLPVLPVTFERDGLRFEYFSAVTTLGTPHDITLQEIRIESFFPADGGTRDRARALAMAAGSR